MKQGASTSEANAKKSKEAQNVSRILSIQYHAKNGNAEELEKILLTQNLASIRQTLDAALIEAIRQARISTDHLLCVKLLFSMGANLNIVLEDGSTPLMLAAQKGALEMVQWILDKDVNVNHRDHQQRNCLFYAMLSNADNADVVRALLEKGAKVDQEDQDGYTPLMKACDQGLVHSLKVLLEYNANVNYTKSATGDTPLHLAAKSKSPAAVKCVEALINSGATVMVTNKAKKTPLDEAWVNKKHEIYETLKAHLETSLQAADKIGQELVEAEKEAAALRFALPPPKMEEDEMKESAFSQKEYATKKELIKKGASTPKAAQPVPIQKSSFSPHQEPLKDPLVGIMQGNRALGFANGLPAIMPKIEVDEAQIMALEGEAKKKEETIATLTEKIKVHTDTIKQRETRIANLEKKVKEKEAKLSSIVDKSAPPPKVAVEPTIPPLYPAPALQNFPDKAELYQILTTELEGFCGWVKTQAAVERPIREKCISELKAALAGLHSNLDLVPYGSYAADLWFASSGIDLVIVAKTGEVPLKQEQLLNELKEVVEQKQWLSSANLIIRAIANILKLECVVDDTTLTVYVTVQDSRHKGLECVKLIKEYIKTYKFFEPIAIVFKYLFKLADLNDSYMKGIGSYGILLLVAAFCQVHQEILEKCTLGQWFLECLLFYLRFDFHHTAIFPQNPNVAYPVEVYSPLMEYRPFATVCDPLVSVNNVTKSTYRIEEIQEALRAAFLGIGSSYGCYCPAKGVRSVLGKAFAAVTGLAISNKMKHQYC